MWCVELNKERVSLLPLSLLITGSLNISGELKVKEKYLSGSLTLEKEIAKKRMLIIIMWVMIKNYEVEAYHHHQ